MNICESWTINRRMSIKELMLLNGGAEKTLESPLNRKEIKPVNPKGNQPWIFIGRTDAKAGAPLLWPPGVKSWLIRKDWEVLGQEEKGMTEDEMIRQHHRLNGHEFGQTPGDSEGQGSLTCCSPWIHSQTWFTVWTTTIPSATQFPSLPSSQASSGLPSHSLNKIWILGMDLKTPHHLPLHCLPADTAFSARSPRLLTAHWDGHFLQAGQPSGQPWERHTGGIFLLPPRRVTEQTGDRGRWAPSLPLFFYFFLLPQAQQLARNMC